MTKKSSPKKVSTKRLRELLLGAECEAALDDPRDFIVNYFRDGDPGFKGFDNMSRKELIDYAVESGIGIRNLS